MLRLLISVEFSIRKLDRVGTFMKVELENSGYVLKYLEKTKTNTFC